MATNANAARGIAVAGLALLATACGLVDPDAAWGERQRALDRARSDWEGAGVASYRYDLEIGCFCGLTGRFLVTVDDGAVVAAERADEGPPVPEEQLPILSTVDELFDTLQEAIDAEADQLEVEYHSGLGYPTRIQLDRDDWTSDDELWIRVRDLVVH